jgi:hypothetical protein
MRRKFTTVSIILVSAFIFSACGKSYPKAAITGKVSASAKIYRVGERIIYDVRMGRLSLGSAVFECTPRQRIDGVELNSVTFETKLAGFGDLEEIYSDPETFLPVKIERFISTWPHPERITEYYDQKKFTLTIKKIKGSYTEKMVFKRDGYINNAILLPYYVRDKANLEAGFNLLARLPRQDFLIKLDGKQEIRVPAGKFMAYHFVSEPRKFEIWVSADSRRIPLKIKGANSLGYTLVMKEYRPGK